MVSRDTNGLPGITTMLITRDQILRLGVHKILAAPKYRLIGTATGTAELGEHVAREQPQVVIIDSQAERDLSALIQHIKALIPNGKTILLTGLDEAGWNWQTFSSGVEGVILKIQPPTALTACIETLCGLTADASRDVTFPHANGSSGDGVLNSERRISRSPQRAGSLTEREREIVALIGEGLSNKDIADRLSISAITVRHHLTSIFDKLGVATRQKLLIRAHQYGLVEFSVPA
jgi:DNA-binding NarL/FixJ family response regulator